MKPCKKLLTLDMKLSEPPEENQPRHYSKRGCSKRVVFEGTEKGCLLPFSVPSKQ
jgi:hypothetical protein